MSPAMREPTPTGGTGTTSRVVVDPAELRAVATRYTDAAGDIGAISGRVGCRLLPEMPPDITGRVTHELQSLSSTIASIATPYPNNAKELRVRALWAEISAAGGTVSGLSASQLRDFVAFMKDGSMIDYATTSQREIAGMLVADLYRDHYKEPEKLIELAAIMKANGTDEDFAGSFIESFGAERFADIPRVIQAMQWNEAMMTTASVLDDQQYDRDLAHDLWVAGYRFDGDAAELLSNFSMVLATATYSGTLSRSTQQQLAYDDDAWAVAQLLHEGTFGAEFLRDAFHNGVIAQIGKEGGNRGWGEQRLYDYPIGGVNGEQLSTDQKQIILDALERNPEAAALAFSSDVPEQFQFGVLDGQKDPIEILYDHMQFDDDGEEQFGRLYDSATDYYQHVDHRPDLAGRMTQSLIERTLYGERDLDEMTRALSHDLADHHMTSLFESAASTSLVDPDRGDPGWLDAKDGYKLNMNIDQMSDLIRAIGEDDDAFRTFTDGAARTEAQIIADGAKPGEGYGWANQVGGFNGVMEVATELDNQDDFDASNERHRLVFSAANNAAGLIKSSGVAAVVGFGLDELDHLTEPDIRDMIDENNKFESVRDNLLRVAIAEGYHANGGLPDLDDRFMTGNQMTSWNDLSATDREELLQWVGGHSNDPDLQEAFNNARDQRAEVFEVLLR